MTSCFSQISNQSGIFALIFAHYFYILYYTESGFQDQSINDDDEYRDQILNEIHFRLTSGATPTEGDNVFH